MSRGLLFRPASRHVHLHSIRAAVSAPSVLYGVRVAPQLWTSGVRPTARQVGMVKFWRPLRVKVLLNGREQWYLSDFCSSASRQMHLSARETAGRALVWNLRPPRKADVRRSGWSPLVCCAGEQNRGAAMIRMKHPGPALCERSTTGDSCRSAATGKASDRRCRSQTDFTRPRSFLTG